MVYRFDAIRRSWLIPVGLLFASAMSCGFCSPCGSETSDEERILGLIARATQLAEKHDLGGLIKLTTDDFGVSPRNLSRRDVKRYLFLFFRGYREFDLMYPRPAVTVDPDGVNATAGVLVLLVRGGESAPDLTDVGDDPQAWFEKASRMANLFRIRLALRKVDGDWVVTRAHFERFKGLGFGD